MHLAQRLLITFGLLSAALYGAEDVAVRPQPSAAVQNSQPVYYWKAEPVAETAQLLTLFCSDCGPLSSSATAESATHDIPLVAVLRDTLGDYQSDNDRVTDVWLLDYANPGLGKKLLSAVPFFYWHPGEGSKSAGAENPKPLLDLTAPEHPVLSEVGRNLIQWTTLDPMTMPVRATTRAYRSNGLDDERLHLESAVAYLRSAPVADDGSALTRGELDTVIARLELRKKLLGGLVSEKNAAKVGEEAGFEEERIRSRNWELLRQIAERTGLVFEPLNVAGQDGQYAMLWFVGQPAPVTGTNLKPIWKLLNISDPYTDTRLLDDHARIQYVRAFDADGSMLPMGAAGARQETMVPLGVYSLIYPKLPLLLVDFRDQVHVRRHEMTQRSINEITAGVIGISHFTNWYYYVAADLYDFVSGRHGAAMDQSERLDAYSRLRVSLTLDRQLDPDLRKSIRARLDDVSVNPLEAAPAREMRNAQVRYARLEEESGSGGRLATLLDQQRRAEIAEFGKSNGRLDTDLVLHTATLGMYHDRAPRSVDNLAKLDVYRRVEHQLSFLDSLNEAGTQPEVAYDAARIQASVDQLSSLMPEVDAPRVRAHAIATLEKLKSISQSSELQADCSNAIAGLTKPPTVGIVAAVAIATESGK